MFASLGLQYNHSHTHTLFWLKELRLFCHVSCKTIQIHPFPYFQRSLFWSELCITVSRYLSNPKSNSWFLWRIFFGATLVPKPQYISSIQNKNRFGFEQFFGANLTPRRWNLFVHLCSCPGLCLFLLYLCGCLSVCVCSVLASVPNWRQKITKSVEPK